ncbi:DoxX family protein [Salinigranum halophilum]|uniref:DoxX family protein n=1 Tax=Salinigranum halophilum TaxID=2565931 RepID=UPI0010A7C454|nr:DoxX family membrane protein [Salinigranum halophilum]
MALEGEFLLLGRVLFGLLFLYNGYNHFANNEAVTGYAEFKGVPAAGFMVVASGVMMLLGGLGIILGAFPVLSVGAIAVFLLVSSPKMHDFWAASDEDRQNEFNHFLKNVGLLGGALVLLASASEPWAYAVNVGLF